MRASRERALTMPTIWRSAVERSETTAFASTCNSSESRRARAWRIVAALSKKPPPVFCSCPRKMFSATVSVGTRMLSWYTVRIPSEIAWRGVREAWDRPKSTISPASGVRAPGENLYERGLARAVLADQAVDLSGPQREIHGIEGDDAGKALAQAANVQKPFHFAFCPPFGPMKGGRGPAPSSRPDFVDYFAPRSS